MNFIIKKKNSPWENVDLRMTIKKEPIIIANNF